MSGSSSSSRMRRRAGSPSSAVASASRAAAAGERLHRGVVGPAQLAGPRQLQVQPLRADVRERLAAQRGVEDVRRDLGVEADARQRAAGRAEAGRAVRVAPRELPDEQRLDLVADERPVGGDDRRGERRGRLGVRGERPAVRTGDREAQQRARDGDAGRRAPRPPRAPAATRARPPTSSPGPNRSTDVGVGQQRRQPTARVQVGEHDRGARLGWCHHASSASAAAPTAPKSSDSWRSVPSPAVERPRASCAAGHDRRGHRTAAVRLPQQLAGRRLPPRPPSAAAAPRASGTRTPGTAAAPPRGRSRPGARSPGPARWARAARWSPARATAAHRRGARAASRAACPA